MKNLLLPTLILLLITFTHSSAQVRAYGFKVGAIAARESFNYSLFPFASHDSEIHWGYDLGFSTEWKFLPAVSASTEVHITQHRERRGLPKTTPAFPEGTGEIITYTSSLYYLSFPLLGKGRIEFGQGEVYFQAGARIDLRLTGKDDYDLLKQHSRNVAYGGTFGSGVQLNGLLMNRNMGLEFRYSPNIGYEYSNDSLKISRSAMEMLLVIGL